MESASLTHRHRCRSGESSALVFITHSIHSLYTTIVAARQKRTIVRGARRKGTAIVKPSLDIGECSSS
ncbi:uncharacterized protein G2W53_039304 [Senna tora]|uniref:Uncharacterized protein n=1 Tax=Senna tora TaxID=362788 RepID=A0A834SMI0_9FABA|nr:uncharacterized protein G2W53_039304 [Senna tora]